MTTMYVANCTRQIQDFMYRLPEQTKVMKQIIDIGGQIRIPGDLSTPDVEAIVEQHAIYGMVRVDEIDRTKPFVGVCYSLDKPVSVDKIRIALQHNQDVLVERGRKIREETAVSINNAMEDQTNALESLEVSIEEIEKDGKDTQVNEKIRVDKTAPETGPIRNARRGSVPRKGG